MPGKWQLIVNATNTYVAEPIPYQVAVSARAKISVKLLLPALLGNRLFTGNRVALPLLLGDAGDRHESASCHPSCRA